MVPVLSPSMRLKILYQLPPARCHFSAALCISSTARWMASSSSGQVSTSRRYKQRVHSLEVASPEPSASTMAHRARRSSRDSPGRSSSGVERCPMLCATRLMVASSSAKVKRPLSSPSLASRKSLPQSNRVEVFPRMPRFVQYIWSARSSARPALRSSSRVRSGTRASSAFDSLRPRIFFEYSVSLCEESARPCCRMNAVNSLVVTLPDRSVSKAFQRPRTSSSLTSLRVICNRG
mmetsp:Transcript_41811/g.89109  ORF Transcript_41811/g.89109 Transcript_41811/m.89109 type:complete len:235 (+) Transcript_41811:640-1344(+)